MKLILSFALLFTTFWSTTGFSAEERFRQMAAEFENLTKNARSLGEGLGSGMNSDRVYLRGIGENLDKISARLVDMGVDRNIIGAAVDFGTRKGLKKYFDNLALVGTAAIGAYTFTSANIEATEAAHKNETLKQALGSIKDPEIRADLHGLLNLESDQQ